MSHQLNLFTVLDRLPFWCFIADEGTPEKTRAESCKHISSMEPVELGLGLNVRLPFASRNVRHLNFGFEVNICSLLASGYRRLEELDQSEAEATSEAPSRVST